MAFAAGTLIAVWQDTYKAQNDANEAAKSFAEEVAGYAEGIEGAKSAFENFNTATGQSSAEIQNLEAKISETQGKITELAKKAAEESREYTDAEREEIEKLIGLIADYTTKKVEAYQEQARMYQAYVAAERQISSERANELIKGAEDVKTQTYAIAEMQYMDAIKLAEEKYGHMGALDKVRYDNAVQTAQEQRDKQIEYADNTFTDTITIVSDKVAKEGELENNYVKKLKQLTEEKISENKRWKEDVGDMTETEIEMSNRLLNNAETHQDETNRIANELRDTYKGAAKADLDMWLAMQYHTQLYGGSISTENQTMINNIMTAFRQLPPETRQSMQDSLTAAIDELVAGNPRLRSRGEQLKNSIINGMSGLRYDMDSQGVNVVDALANGIARRAWRAENEASRLARAVSRASASGFQINSPSKIFEWQAEMNIMGLVGGFVKNTYKAEREVKKTTSKLIDAMTIKPKDIELPEMIGLNEIATRARTSVVNSSSVWSPVINLYIQGGLVDNQTMNRIQQATMNGLRQAQVRTERSA